MDFSANRYAQELFYTIDHQTNGAHGFFLNLDSRRRRAWPSRRCPHRRMPKPHPKALILVQMGYSHSQELNKSEDGLLTVGRRVPCPAHDDRRPGEGSWLQRGIPPTILIFRAWEDPPGVRRPPANTNFLSSTLERRRAQEQRRRLESFPTMAARCLGFLDMAQRWKMWTKGRLI
jgi:hypothetical protein